jgi:hypothetical protein
MPSRSARTRLCPSAWLAGDIAEGRRWIDEALASASAPTLERARALHTAGSLADLQQGYADARRFVNESLALSRKLDDEAGESWARLTLGFTEFRAENPGEATRQLERSLKMHEELGQRLGVSRSLTILGATMTLVASSAEEGRRALERARQAAHDLQDSCGEAFGLYSSDSQISTRESPSWPPPICAGRR